MNIEEKYLDITEPSNFIKLFKSEDEFSEWLDMGSVRDLECTLKEFEDSELYEYCSIIHNILVHKRKVEYVQDN